MDLIAHFNSHMRSLKTQGRAVDHWDDLLVYLLKSKLDADTRMKWIDKAPTNKLATFNEISEFIRTTCLKLDAQDSHTLKPSQSHSSHSPKPRQIHASSFHLKAKTYSCSHCNATGHTIIKCSTFKTLSIDKRRQIAEASSLCFNCLGKGHSARDCPSPASCHVCQRKHHTMLHKDATADVKPSPVESQASTSITTNHAAVSLPTQTNSQYILLATAKVDVMDAFGNPVAARALLDSGSQRNFMTQSFANRINATVMYDSEKISGIGSARVTSASRSTISITSRTSTFSAKLSCLVLDKITGVLPSLQLDVSAFKIPNNIQLADPEFHLPREIDLLIGATLFFDLMSIGQIKLSKGLPTLQNTRLGWVLSGPMNLAELTPPTESTFSGACTDELESQIEKFWHIEAVPAGSKKVSTYDHVADKHFVATHTRDNDGRFVVRLPFKENPSNLGDSSTMARKRFQNLEKRLIREPSLGQAYKTFIAEYKDLNHMVKVPNDAVEIMNYYFPHHCILKPDSSTTKLRVVFDGSAKSTTGKSLARRIGLVQQLNQHFWSRWSKEYMHTLQQRGKWRDKSPNIKINDFVLIKDENLPPLKWKTGRVIELHPGSDGLTRVITVKTSSGHYVRAITKICPLPIDVEPDTVQGGENVRD